MMSGKTYLWAEYLVLFGVVPAAYYYDMIPLPKIPVLLTFALGGLFWLLSKTDFSWRSLWKLKSDTRAAMGWIMARSLVVGSAAATIAYLVDPALFLGFPRNRPWLWLLVMGLYPILSAYPQEIVYRAFLFRRYERIFPTVQSRILASTIAFSFLHVVFENWIAVVLTLPAGYIFSQTYASSGSLFLAAFEHALYGCMIFTSGLGRFFYHPG